MGRASGRTGNSSSGGRRASPGLSTVELTPIAERIRVHLQRFEADPLINATRASGGLMLTPYYTVSAYAERKRVHVQYIITHGHTALSGAEAVRYLAWLDAGGVGSHYEALRSR